MRPRNRVPSPQEADLDPWLGTGDAETELQRILKLRRQVQRRGTQPDQPGRAGEPLVGCWGEKDSSRHSWVYNWVVGHRDCQLGEIDVEEATGEGQLDMLLARGRLAACVL